MSRKENGRYVPRIVWDVVPSYWGAHIDCMDPVRWRECVISAAIPIQWRSTTG